MGAVVRLLGILSISSFSRVSPAVRLCRSPLTIKMITGRILRDTKKS